MITIKEEHVAYLAKYIVKEARTSPGPVEKVDCARILVSCTGMDFGDCLDIITAVVDPIDPVIAALRFAVATPWPRAAS